MSLPFTVSFEFFPPKDEAGRTALIEAVKELAAFRPEFVTVTFGTGGLTKERTFETAKYLQQETDLNVGVHLSYFGIPKAELFAYVDKLWENNIRYLVALRGDIPAEQKTLNFKEPDYFENTGTFVRALLTRHPFDISVGAYPEKHPDALTLADDIVALGKKCDAGAVRAITQFFFEPGIYRTFMKEVRAAGISTPITPGLLPVSDFEKISAFAAKCQARIPPFFKDIFVETSDPCRTGINLLVQQIKDLQSLGATHFHFYTLNRSDMISSTLKSFLKEDFHDIGN